MNPAALDNAPSIAFTPFLLPAVRTRQVTALYSTAEIRAFPTVAPILVPASANINLTHVPLYVFMVRTASTIAFSNIDPLASFGLFASSIGGARVTSLISENPSPQVSEFFAGVTFNLDRTAIFWGMGDQPALDHLGNFQGTDLVLGFNNQAAGDLLDGDGATLRVALIYATLDLSTGVFV